MFGIRRLFGHRSGNESEISRREPKRPRIGGLEGKFALAVLLVGPSHEFNLPSQAAKVAKDGDVVRIDAGTYRGDVSVWKANNLTITTPNGRAKIDATGMAIPNRKGIWVIAGNNTLVENIEFAGAHDAAGRDKNWAGIRLDGSTLTVGNCFFHDNDDGILSGANPTSDVVVKGSEFAANGYGDGYSHNMYIGQVRSFTLENCFSHDAKSGHLVKSRALTNRIQYNILMDGRDGASSFEVDLPNGGASYVIGNIIRQGPNGQNSAILKYAEEGASNPVQALYVVNNTFVNDLGRGTFVSVSGKPTASILMNNIFAGGGTPLSGPGTLSTNLASKKPGFVNPASYDYRLTKDSPAIDAGTSPEPIDGVSLAPLYQYANPRWSERPKHKSIDIGAFEY